MPPATLHADSFGNPLTLDDAASLPLVEDFVTGFVSTEARAVNLLALAERDASPLVQAYCATLHLFAESRDAAANARPFLEKARAAFARATPREQRYIAAVEAWAGGDITKAIGLHAEQAREYPRDLVSVKLGQYHCFNTGDCPGMLRLALAALPAASDVPYVHGMAAFGYEQCHLMRDAEASARRAIGMCRKEPWAHHALAHVMLTEGRLAEGLAFMQGVSDTWSGLNSFMVTHNWWHVALFLIELGRDAEALTVYDREVWAVAKDYSQDQIGAVSLLARLELAGIDVGARWSEVGPLPGAAAGRSCAAFPRPAVPVWPCARGSARSRSAAAQHRGLCAARAALDPRGLAARVRAGRARARRPCARQFLWRHRRPWHGIAAPARNRRQPCAARPVRAGVSRRAREYRQRSHAHRRAKRPAAATQRPAGVAAPAAPDR
jgi:hypothetical protein